MLSVTASTCQCGMNEPPWSYFQHYLIGPGMLGSISLSFQSSQSGYMLVLYGDRFQMEME